MLTSDQPTPEAPVVRVYVCEPPTDATRAYIDEKLKPIFGEDASIIVEVDPTILGGVVVHSEDRLIDASIRGRIGELGRFLRTVDIVPSDKAADPRAIIGALKSALAGMSFPVREERVGTVTSVGDGVVHISGLENAMIGEKVIIGDSVPASVLDLDEREAGCILLGPWTDIREGDIARCTGHVIDVPVGPELIGRVVNPLGEPIDGKGGIRSLRRRKIEAPAPKVSEREPVRMPLQTGLKVIDALVPIGRGQRELIIGDRQTGKTAIALDTILNQKDSGVVCIYVAIGQKASTVAQVIKTLEERGAMAYTMVVVASSSDPAPLRYIAPYAGCAMAEEFMYSGKDVLIVYDDLSKHAVAHRELSLLLRRPPGREAYPGDIFYVHGRLLERAGKLTEALGGGSMTALPIVETLGGDISSYIPTNIISITDGQIFTEADLFFAGNRPAVNVGLSVSRVGGDAQIPAMKKIAGPLRLELAQYREHSAFAQFGADLDKATRQQLARGERLTEALKQRQYSPMPVEEQCVFLYALVSPGIEGLKVEDMPEFETRLISFVRENYPGVLRRIKQTGVLSEDDARLLSEASSRVRQGLSGEGQAKAS